MQVPQQHRRARPPVGEKTYAVSAKGYGSFQSAWRTLETVNMIRKGRVRWVTKDDVSAQARFVAKLFGIRCLDFSPLQLHLALDLCSLKLRNRTFPEILLWGGFISESIDLFRRVRSPRFPVSHQSTSFKPLSDSIGRRCAVICARTQAWGTSRYRGQRESNPASAKGDQGQAHHADLAQDRP